MNDPYVLLVLGSIPGHISWLLWLGNNIHAQAWPRRLIKALGFVINSCLAAGSVAAVLWIVARGLDLSPTLATPGNSLAHVTALLGRWNVPLPFELRIYVDLCAINVFFGFLPWLLRRIQRTDPDVLLSDDTVVHDLRPALVPPTTHSLYGRLMSTLPLNEVLQLAVQTKRIAPPRLPAQLAGLKIAHLTDVHLTGIIDRRYYERAIDLVNEAEPDLVLLTGDLLETESCWDWIPTTLGKLRARHGVYFIFGNHDIRVDHEETRRRLIAAGLIDVGIRRTTVSIRGIDVVLAGTAMPWLKPAAPMDDCPPRNNGREFRILLSHSPDQLPWARLHGFDLMVAGHVHGGQIQFPPLGPILAPSSYGTRYASGTFHEPPTILHVGRGLSSKLPLRLFCKPEATILVLERPVSRTSQ
ncbi:MAG: metallophosphoesterase [Planctomycetia bacterium]|nr:metallophosphoesterase [Planctomycetia bacterium]